jgi:hypothetical protein
VIGVRGGGIIVGDAISGVGAGVLLMEVKFEGRLGGGGGGAVFAGALPSYILSAGTGNITFLLTHFLRSLS